jgi:hypothetical protein
LLGHDSLLICKVLNDLRFESPDSTNMTQFSFQAFRSGSFPQKSSDFGRYVTRVVAPSAESRREDEFLSENRDGIGFALSFLGGARPAFIPY